MTAQILNEIKPYEQTLNELEENLNKKRGFNQEQFLNSLRILKEQFNKEISTAFLRELIHSKTNRQKTFKLAYLLRTAGLTKQRQTKHFKEWVFQKYSTEITEYQHSKSLVYSSPCELSEEEKKQIAEIKAIKENTGFDLLGTAEPNFKERQRKRNAINKDGGVNVKEYRTQQVGKDYIAITHKVFYFIGGY